MEFKIIEMLTVRDYNMILELDSATVSPTELQLKLSSMFLGPSSSNDKARLLIIYQLLNDDKYLNDESLLYDLFKQCPWVAHPRREAFRVYASLSRIKYYMLKYNLGIPNKEFLE